MHDCWKSASGVNESGLSFGVKRVISHLLWRWGHGNRRGKKPQLSSVAYPWPRLAEGAAATPPLTRQTTPHFRTCKWAVQLRPASCLGGNLLTPPSVRWEGTKAGSGWRRKNECKEWEGGGQNGQIGLAASDTASPAGCMNITCSSKFSLLRLLLMRARRKIHFVFFPHNLLGV